MDSIDENGHPSLKHIPGLVIEFFKKGALESVYRS
jgi:hypothetical protein